ncbi:MAG: methyltransferase [candidate division Zixibacteria bacterium]|nr:methyltransferase [candidate division Zixibacteria bacterium]
MGEFDVDAWRAVEEAVRLENERQRAAGLPPARRYRALHPKAAEFLYLLALASGARRIVEVGTSAGYSTLWLARACVATGGVVVTLELEAGMAEVARGHLELAGVSDLVEIRPGDARETLPQLVGPFDLAFVDAEKAEYVDYGELLWPKLAAGASLVADNVVSHAEATAPFLAWLRARGDAATTVLEVGNGLAWAVKGRT